MELSDQLHCVFSAAVDERADTYTIEVPKRELDLGPLVSGQTYRVAILPAPTDESGRPDDTQRESDVHIQDGERRPPVEEGDERPVEIVGIGDQGDGITRIEGGFVVIVPDTEKGERARIEITDVRETVAFGEVVERLSYYA
jgi:predicted RNA-binding protein with TRAM domain